jgi:murein L,D-transpeptidase YcbB/YkuD
LHFGTQAILRANKIRVFEQGVEISPRTANWQAINHSYQPYVLVQDSGNVNALGRIKFNFGNPFSVYLHDTNSKSAFNRHNRAVSHGCVRVEKPLELAYFCLPEVDPTDKKQVDKNDLLKDKIRHSIGLKVLSKAGKAWLANDTTSSKLSKMRIQPNVPIIIDYRTCCLNPKGDVFFRDDMYGMDSILNQRLVDLKLYAE